MQAIWFGNRKKTLVDISCELEYFQIDSQVWKILQRPLAFSPQLASLWLPANSWTKINDHKRFTSASLLQLLSLLLSLLLFLLFLFNYHINGLVLTVLESDRKTAGFQPIGPRSAWARAEDWDRSVKWLRSPTGLLPAIKTRAVLARR